jgi:signal transduction histidine kinase
MLFAPTALHYLRLENDVAVPCGVIPDDMLATLRALPAEHAWTPDGQGFLLRISHGDEKLGLLAVDRLAFPAYRERYLNMALAVTGVCGLAIENARNRRRLLEAEKMASLSILVAGVAHEINTPLGVRLAASSTLEDQSRHLAARFAARSMTKSDLSRYLDIATTSTGLMRQNLERIGRLIDAFRQVAVAGNTFQNQRFRLRACLDEVVASLGERLSAAGVELAIDCAPELEIDAVAGDWASILGNLIGNSLKHGFKDRARGRIDIRVARLAKNRLRVDYRDDGRGMTPEVQARIFDPFFTTDLQQGMGLGLHLVYNLVTQRMGGSIRCESAPNQGAQFQIELPLAPPAVSPAPTF